MSSIWPQVSAKVLLQTYGLSVDTTCLWAPVLLVLNPRCIPAIKCWMATGPAWPHDLVGLTEVRSTCMVCWSISTGSNPTFSKITFSVISVFSWSSFTMQPLVSVFCAILKQCAQKWKSNKRHIFLKGAGPQKSKDKNPNLTSCLNCNLVFCSR